MGYHFRISSNICISNYKWAHFPFGHINALKKAHSNTLSYSYKLNLTYNALFQRIDKFLYSEESVKLLNTVTVSLPPHARLRGILLEARLRYIYGIISLQEFILASKKAVSNFKREQLTKIEDEINRLRDLISYLIKAIKKVILNHKYLLRTKTSVIFKNLEDTDSI